ncbi:MAG: hypothetical protein LBJ08_09795 [Bifidobacteriaceae bacterium]|jgi:5-hydroxyisourate hydrolase-like protein (transthyretin family)|nr:hypothetical protein [Bifidobacteriaceae bacterium]
MKTHRLTVIASSALLVSGLVAAPASTAAPMDAPAWPGQGVLQAKAAPGVVVAAPKQGALGKKVTVTVTVTQSGKAISGVTVRLQRKIVDTSWTSIDSAKTAKSGKATFKVQLQSDTQYRAKVPASAGVGAATSGAVTTAVEGNQDQRAIVQAAAKKCVAQIRKMGPTFKKQGFAVADMTALYGVYDLSQILVVGTYAFVNEGCSSTDKDDSMRIGGGYASFQRKVAGVWKESFGTQAELSCSQVDGQGWPSSIVASCAIKDGASRTPKPPAKTANAAAEPAATGTVTSAAGSFVDPSGATVDFAVTAPKRGVVGKKATVQVSATNKGKGLKGVAVQLQRKIVGTAWTVIGSAKTAKGGKATFEVPFRSKTQYRAQIAATAGAATSGAVTTAVQGTKDQRAIVQAAAKACVAQTKQRIAENSDIQIADMTALYGIYDLGQIQVDGTYAWVNRGCHTTNYSKDSVAETGGLIDQGMISMQRKIRGVWKQSMTPVYPTVLPCSQVDGKGWPTSMVPTCFTKGGTTRAPKK